MPKTGKATGEGSRGPRPRRQRAAGASTPAARYLVTTVRIKPGH
jgi:hypothetical protein